MSELENGISSNEELELASRMSRAGAAFFDVLALCVVGIAFIYSTGMLDRLKSMGSSTEDTLLSTAFGLLMFLMVHGYFLFKNGQTFGKWIFDIAIVKNDGAKISGTLIIIKRYLPIWLLSYIPIIGQLIGVINILFIFRKDRRCIHDIIAGTKVVQLVVPD